MTPSDLPATPDHVPQLRPQSRPQPPLQSPLRHPGLLLLLTCSFLFLLGMVMFLMPELGRNGAITDYDAFFVVGTLVLEGRSAVAYHVPDMTAEMIRLINTDEILPWTYPPMFNLVTGVLALAERGIGFGLFVGSTLIAWTWLLWRIGADRSNWVVWLIFPAHFTQLITGQTGYLIAALAAAFALVWLKGEREGQTRERQIAAGLLLGLMCLKPHLGVGIGIMALLRRQWWLAGTALGVTAGLAALATLVLGAEIWPAFLSGVSEAGENLRRGIYQFARMSSLYSSLASLGLPAGAAMAGQLLLAALLLGALARLALRPATRPEHLLALAMVAGFGLSPYSYDYDLPLAAVALALVSQEIFAKASRGELTGLLLLGWLSAKSGLGFVLSMIIGKEAPIVQFLYAPLPGGLAPGGVTLLVLLIWVVAILRRSAGPAG